MQTTKPLPHHRHRPAARWLGGLALAALSFTAAGLSSEAPSPAEKARLEQRGFRLIGDHGEVLLPDALRGLRSTAPDRKLPADSRLTALKPNPWPLTPAQIAADRLLQATDFRLQTPNRAAVDALRAAAAAEGSARVIVTLKLRMTPEGLLGEALAQTQRREIAMIQARVLQALQPLKAEVRHQYRVVPMLALRATPSVIDRLAAHPDVADIQPDLEFAPALQDSVPLIGAADVQDLGIKGGNGDYSGVVAVLDTGIDLGHPFLRGAVGEACFSSSADCPNGQSAQVGPGAGAKCTFSAGAYASSCDHGTHVAGIAVGAAQAGFTSLNGVAPDTRVMPIQVFGRRSGTRCGKTATASDVCARSFTSDQIAALQYVYDQRNSYRIAAANMSLGDSVRNLDACDSHPLKPIIDSLRSVNIATVIAAGNDGYPDGLSTPGCISTAISVAATDKNNAIASYSNRSKDVKLFAPGTDITSSCPGSSFCVKSGTSMAAPHVTGTFSLLRDAMPGNSVDQNLQALRYTGVMVGNTTTATGTSVPYLRIFIPPAAGLDLVHLVPGVPRARRAPDPYRHAYEVVTSRNAWSAVAVRADTAASLAVDLFDSVTGGTTIGVNYAPTPLARSYSTGDTTGVIAQDGNYGRRPLGADRIEVGRGSPSSAYSIEQTRDDSPLLQTVINDAFDAPTGVIRIYDSQTSAGLTQYLRVVPASGLDVELLVFTSSSSSAASSIRTREQATAISSSAGAGAGEALQFTPTEAGFAGVAVVNRLGNAGRYTVYRDSSAPTGSVQINDGAARTRSPGVTLTLNASDAETGVDSYRVAPDGHSFGPWRPYDPANPRVPVTLAASSGTATVAVQYRNGAFQPSAIVTDTIELSGLPSLAISDVRVVEGNAGSVSASFRITLSAASSDTVSVHFSMASGTATAGSDYLKLRSGTLTFSPGQTSKSVAVTVYGDTEGEPDETVFGRLDSPVNATIADDEGVLTIVNDDGPVLPKLSIADLSLPEGSAGAVMAKLKVRLSAASADTVTVQYATADGSATAGSDYKARSGTLTFAPGATSASISITVNGDTVAEADETFVVNLSNPGNAVISDGQGLITLGNDD